jgi:hypothetical protein
VRKPKEEPPVSKRVLTPLTVLGYIADAAGVITLVVGQFSLIVLVLVFLMALFCLTMLIVRSKQSIDRLNWLAIGCLMFSAVLLALMVPPARAQMAVQAGGSALPAASASSAATSTATPPAAGVTPNSSVDSASPSIGSMSSTNLAKPRALYQDAVVLDLYDGIDVDNGGVISHNLKTATGAIDLFLDHGPGGITIVVPNANHNQMAQYTGGNEDGAAKRCPVDLQTATESSAYGNIPLQFCFVTSDGHVGYFEPTKELPDGTTVALTIRVWDEPPLS